MRAFRASTVLASLLLAACSGDPSPGEAPRVARRPARVAPIERAPTIAAQLEACAATPPDSAALGDAVLAARFAELETTLDALLQAYAADPGCEEHLWTAFHALAQQELAPLDRWVAERGDSWAASTARAGHWLDVGYASRGWKLAKDVSEAQWEGMREAFVRSDADVRRAALLRPDAFVAYGYAIRMRKLSGDGELEWLSALLARDPLNSGVRERAIEALAPKWGGSLELMAEIAEQAQPFADRNPRLRILPGFAVVEGANVAWRAGDLAQAAAGYRRGLAYGDLWLWHNGLSKLLDKQHQWQALKAQADAWLAIESRDDAPWMWRGRASLGLGNPAGALEGFERARSLKPQDFYLLRMRGDALGRLGRLADSLADYEAALALQPGDEWTIGQVAKARARLEAHSQGGGTLPALSRLGLASEGPKGDAR